MLLDDTAPTIEEAPSDDATRKPRVRGRTISIKRLSKRELERGRYEADAAMRETFGDELPTFPATRGECVQGENAERPCPFVSCKHHLYLDVSPRSGAIKLNFPNLEVWDMPESCALDVADRGGTSLEEVATNIALVRERIRQIETRGLAKLKALSSLAGLMDYIE